MKLDNKADKKIKKFLKSVSEDYRESKIYNSIHYYISVNGVLKDFRFSDHISMKSSFKAYLDIIKITEDTYCLNYKQGVLQFGANTENVFEIIKGFVYLQDYIEDCIDKNTKSFKKLIKEYGDIKSLYGDIKKKFDTIKEERDKLSKTNLDKNKTIQSLNTKCSNHLLTIKQYQTEKIEYEGECNKLNKRINALNQDIINKDLKLSKLNDYITTLNNTIKNLKFENEQILSKKNTLIDNIKKLISKWKQ